jgi:hypothetical protein
LAVRLVQNQVKEVVCRRNEAVQQKPELEKESRTEAQWFEAMDTSYVYRMTWGKGDQRNSQLC